MTSNEKATHRDGEDVFAAPVTSAGEKLVRELCGQMGIGVDGPEPIDIQVRDSRFYDAVLSEGALGFGESFMRGWWDCRDLAGLVARLAHEDAEKRLGRSWRLRWEALKARMLNLQSRQRAAIVGRAHYDLTLDAYRSMTDRWITLSCAYWKDARDLDEAQESKLDLICRKIGIEAGDRVLDIGCGFGSFARFAAERYGCQVVGINISPKQAEAAQALAADLPVKIVNCDYRDGPAYLGDGPFDKVVSAGMFEHVGYKNFRSYFEAAHAALKDGGMFLLHTCGSSVSLTHNDPWFDEYIFPNGLLPSIKQVGEAIEGLFVMEDWHNFGFDYSLTLESWYERFDRSWDGDKSDPFYRMWKYYLLACAGWFRARYVQLWHVVLSKGGVAGGYTSVR